MIIVVVTIFLITFWIFKNEFRKLQLAWNFPGPPALPIIGNGFDLVNKSSLGLNKIQKIMQ